jgi:superoxide dismutase, Fe-Mn family
MFKLPEINFSKVHFLPDETIDCHFGKHHKSYIDRLNQLTEGLPRSDILDFIRKGQGPIYNNAAQAWNHTFFWLVLTPEPSRLNSDSELARKIKKQFGDLDGLKSKFFEAGMSLFGSGWTWLAVNNQNFSLEILNTTNADIVDFEKYSPVLICDVWEHAYYIEYRNSRANYLDGFWRSINWKFVEDNFVNKNYENVGRLMQS